jgi:hypothetical protein
MVGDMSKLFAMAAGLLCGTTVLAQGALPDPTRPPAGLQTEGGASSAPAAAEALVLQSVLLNAGRKPAAVISGQIVQLGDLVGELRLASITEHAVQLRGSQGTTTLTLNPDVQKQARPKRPEPSK